MSCSPRVWAISFYFGPEKQVGMSARRALLGLGDSCTWSLGSWAPSISHVVPSGRSASEFEYTQAGLHVSP